MICKQTKELTTNRYIRFVDVTQRLIKDSRIPLYSSKFSKKTYNQHQLLVLLFLKEYIGQDSRSTIDHTDVMTVIKDRIQPDHVPHFTTIHKFSRRSRSIIFSRLLNRLIRLFYNRGQKIPCTAIDSSGFTGSYASHYYSWRTGKTRRRFLKTSIAVDTSHQVIIGLKISQHPVQDTPHTGKVLVQYHRTRKSDSYVMNK